MKRLILDTKIMAVCQSACVSAGINANAKIKAVLMAFYRPLSDVLMSEILTEEKENYDRSIKKRKNV